MNLKKLVKSHTIDYLVIITLLIVFFLSIILFHFSHLTIKTLTVFFALGYAVWGVTHHHKAGHIDKKILLEYLGISFLSVVIVFSLIN